jgi:diketogulonate reductase-like aldo/keto reductase
MTEYSVIPTKVGISKEVEQSLRSYRRSTIDLAQVFSLVDVDAHWPKLKEWKASGRARYIGVTVSEFDLYDELEAFMRREKPDFVQRTIRSRNVAPRSGCCRWHKTAA